MKQFGIKIEKKNKNLKKRAEKKEEPKGSIRSGQDERV